MMAVRRFLMVGLAILVAVSCLIVVVFWLLSRLPHSSPPFRVDQLNDNDIIQLAITRGEKQKRLVGFLDVSVAVSLDAMEQGLSGRSAVPSQGMLFVLPKRDIPRFWMKEMLFDLDMVWIDRDTIVDISHNVPAPDSQTALKDLLIYSPTQPATLVLEIPAGQSKKLGLQIGDSVTFSTD